MWNEISGPCVGVAFVVKKYKLTEIRQTGESAKAGSCATRTETAMKKALTLATFASVIALPAFAQSFDPEFNNISCL